MGYTGSRWIYDTHTGNPIPRVEALTKFIVDNEVAEKDADSLTSDWRKLGVDCKIGTQLDKFMTDWGTWRRCLF